MINEPQFYDDNISDSHILEEYDYDEHLRELEYWIQKHKHNETNKKLQALRQAVPSRKF
jgi:hypothetical protein